VATRSAAVASTTAARGASW